MRTSTRPGRTMATRLATLLATLLPTVAVAVAVAAAQSADIQTASDQATGRDIALNGNARGAQACATCHGETGAGNPAMGAPRLSILGPAYMTAQLEAFRAGRRENALMTPVARALSEAEGRAVSEYYASIGGRGGADTSRAAPSANAAVDTVAGDTALGRRLVHRGDWTRALPPCAGCHGPDATGVEPGFPALAGQHAGYLRAQLDAWRGGQRRGDPMKLMATIAERLTDEESRAAAAYLAALAPDGGGTGRSGRGSGASGGSGADAATGGVR